MERPHARVLAIVTTLVLLGVVAELRYRYVPVIAATAPAQLFSGARASAVRARVLADVSAHPPGTAGAERVRERLLGELTAIGLHPEERVATSCGRYGACAVVHNLVARIAGHASTGAVLLVAHHDSVPAGPGASDDGAGVASVVEIARAIATDAPPRNDVVILLDDGEELGLLGAEAFVRSDPLAREVRAVVNVEARGTEGPATLFQTSRDAAFLVEIFAREAPHPVGSSLFATVYERMPNDTDLTVFLERGLHGVNFAFTSGVERYHTPLDDLAHASTRSLQHEGESALAMVRGLAAIDLSAPSEGGSRGDAVWFDVLGATVVRWPARASLPIAIVGALGVIFAAVASLRARRVRRGELVLGFAAMLAVPLAATVIGALPFLVARAAGALPAPWVAHPTPLLLAFAVAPVLAIVALRSPSSSVQRGAEAAWLGGGLVYALLGTVLAALLPGACYLLVAPLFVAGMAATAASFARVHEVARDFAVGITALATLATWALVLRSLYPALGFEVGPALSLVLSLVLLPLAPLAWVLPARRRALSILSLSVVLATFVAAIVPRFSAETPRRVNVAHRQDETGARVNVDTSWGGRAWGTVPEAMRASLGPTAHEAPAFPWSRANAWVADVAPSGAPIALPEGVELSRTSGPGGAGDGGGLVRRVRLRVRSLRGARGLRLVAPPDSGLVQVELAGALSQPRAMHWDLAPGFRAFAFEGVPAEGIEIMCTLSGPESDVQLLDVSSGIPAHPVLAARPADAVPTQEGDVTIAMRRLRL